MLDLNKKELEKMSFNRSYYEDKAKMFNSSCDVSWGDINAMRMEINNILSYIADNKYVLDAGCSNGFSTFQIAEARDIRMKAFDYSARSIQIAKRMQPSNDPQKKITFCEGNILKIDEKDETFDIVYGIRVLINLPDWKLQRKAILEMRRVLKPRGLYLLSEAFLGSLGKLNALRSMAGIKPLVVQKFNLYIDEPELERFIKPYFDIVEIKKFSSIYYAASRFARYLTMKKGDKDTYVNEINNLFAKYPETEDSGDFGIQKLYVLKKR